MPKAILEFNLPEEREEYQDAISGAAFIGAIQEFDNELRAIIKYGDTEYTEQQIEVYRKVREMLHAQLSSNDLSLWR